MALRARDPNAEGFSPRRAKMTHPSTPDKSSSATPAVATPFGQNDDEKEMAMTRARKSAILKKSLLRDFQELSTAEKGKEPGLPKDVIYDLYHNCVKLASENKINQKNTWDLKLLDHLSEVIHSRDAEEEQTNFQKASCTLEAGVKIYSYRVDSVYTDVYKVLSDMNRSSKRNESEEIPKDLIEETNKKKKEVKTNNAGFSGNIVSSLDTINLTKLDVTFNVDPLFHNATFHWDESSGFFLNNLSVSDGCKLSIDSDRLMHEFNSTNLENQSPEDIIDLSFLSSDISHLFQISKDCSRFTSSLSDIMNEIDESDSTMHESEIEKLRSVVLGSESDSWADDVHLKDIEPNVLDSVHVPHKNFEFEEVVSIDNDCSVCTSEINSNSFDSFDANLNGEADFNGENCTTFDDLERTEEIHQVNELENRGVDWFLSDTNRDSLLKSMINKNDWAKINHWRFKKPQDESVVAEDVIAPKRTRIVKERIKYIDFNTPINIDKSALKPPNKQSEINLTKTATSKKANTLHPLELQYNAAKLTLLTLRPSWGPFGKFRSKGNKQESNAQSDKSETDFVYVSYGDDLALNDDDESELIHPTDNDGAANDDELLDNPRKIEKISVPYDRFSKQVDVHSLKNCLWKCMKQISESSVTELHDTNTVSDESQHEKSRGSEVSFRQMLSAFSEKGNGNSENVSVQICFICVLHLANENSLNLSGNSSLDDFTIHL